MYEYLMSLRTRRRIAAMLIARGKGNNLRVTYVDTNSINSGYSDIRASVKYNFRLCSTVNYIVYHLQKYDDYPTSRQRRTPTL